MGAWILPRQQLGLRRRLLPGLIAFSAICLTIQWQPLNSTKSSCDWEPSSASASHHGLARPSNLCDRGLNATPAAPTALTSSCR